MAAPVRLIPVVTCVALLAHAAAAAAEDWPVLRQGRWQFDRTIEGMGPSPQKVSRTECIDPTANFRRQQEQLAKAGCTFTPLTRRGDEYRYAATCRMAGTATASESVLTVGGSDAYTLRVASKVDGKPTREVLVAKRLGDCVK
jgi:hypothetical protein